ncbi:MAG TPA: triphosphoribosyl-dephospho-CoA synthase [Methylocella sp.]|nr:triphosphoribosyl-dephospho-CoA synthase [Methylocella sp.]
MDGLQGRPVNEIAEAFIAACRDEIEAPKPGNVHVFADGHGMTAADFLLSAEAAAPALCTPSAPVGVRILAAVESTFAAVGMNTNLGIILLCAPLAAAAETGEELHGAVRKILAGLTLADATSAFRAILRASPAGLGTTSRHDVHKDPHVTFLEAMREAAGRDRIAFQYASDFMDIFQTGLSALENARRRGWTAPWPVVSIYLTFLASFPDSHIARKFGLDAAARVQNEARDVQERYINAANPEQAFRDLLSFDRHLKVSGFNPGTSADLTVATVFADRITRILIKRRNFG